jgi:hypothetical protein
MRVLRVNGLIRGHEMTTEDAKSIAEKYVKDEVAVLGLTIDLLKANEMGYKEANDDLNEVWDRITAGKPTK